MQIALPDLETSTTLIPDPDQHFSDGDYLAFCAANPELNIERMPGGEIVIVPPAGGEADYRSMEASGELRDWTKRNRSGNAFGSGVQFFLPDGSGLSPDAAWVSNERLSTVSKNELRQFPHLVPEFVIEVMSPNDRLPAAQKRMCLWATNGVELGWLIDGVNRSVYVYRGTAEPRVMIDAESIAGEGPVEGFVLPLGETWTGL